MAFEWRVCDAWGCLGEAKATDGGWMWCRGHLKVLREADNTLHVDLGTVNGQSMTEFDYVRQFWLPLTEPLEEA